MWHNYNPVFSNGNSRENVDILKDESLIPYTVAVTPFYDESAALADLILPDETYLEVYDFEDRISPTQVPEYYIHQPVVQPQGEARDFKDVCCELAERMGFPLGFKSAEEFLKQSCELTPAVRENTGGLNGMKKWGVWYNKKAKPAYYSYRQPVSAGMLEADGVILDEATGVYWNWKLAGVTGEEEARAKGYRHTADAYKGYVAQKFGDAVYTGFTPDRINKSGYFELYSPILAEKNLPPLPSYMAIPEHQNLKENELVLTTYRVNVQTLYRTQNCRWLDEINTDNPVWINPKTAETMGIGDGDKIKLKTRLGEIESTAKVTHNVVPGVIAISSHGGHWEYGRYASGKKAPYGLDRDSPYEELQWWNTRDDVHPNWIIDNVSEHISGNSGGWIQWFQCPRWQDPHETLPVCPSATVLKLKENIYGF